MKTLTIEVSDEFAKNLDTIRDIFMPGANAGAVIERFSDWVFHNMLNDDGQLLEDAENESYESEEELQAVADRIVDFVKARDDADTFLTYGWLGSGNEWELEFITTKMEDEIYDFCVRTKWKFRHIRELFRLKVSELDEAAKLPSRNWRTNPPDNVAEILALLESDLDAERSRRKMEVAA
jgi:hypothetical protein